MKKYAIGVDIGGTNISMAVVSSKGEVVRKICFPTRHRDGQAKIMQRIIDNLRKISVGIPKDSIQGIGIGCAGDIDQEKGIVRFSPNLSWRNVPIVRLLKREFNTKIILDNDANASAWGAYHINVRKKAKNLICVTLGTGVGGGLILNGRIYRGATGTAGEIGHVTVNPYGERCKCGNRGCLETYVGANYLVRRAVREMKRRDKGLLRQAGKRRATALTPEILHSMALDGHRLARRIWEEAGKYLGIALSGVINLVNPEVIVFAGGISKAGELILGPMRRELKKRTFSIPLKKVKILCSKINEDLGVIGAGLLCLQEHKN